MSKIEFNTICLTTNKEQLNEIKIITKKKKKRIRAKELIEEAINRIPENYPVTPFQFTSYYRDYLKREKKFYNVNEAIIQTIDSGFNSSHYKNRFRLLDYTKNKDFPFNIRIPKKYDSSWPISENYNPRNKFIPYAKMPSQGGNELFILLAHDPVRNFKVNSFAFINNFSKHFIKNHKFSRPIKIYQDDFFYYKINFKTFKPLGNQKKEDNNSVRINYNEPKFLNTEGVFIEGAIFINPKDFTIHKIEYEATLKSSMEKMYKLNLEYGYSKIDNLTMQLKYISFNNAFFAPDINEKNPFKIESYKKTNGSTTICGD